MNSIGNGKKENGKLQVHLKKIPCLTILFLDKLLKFKEFKYLFLNYVSLKNINESILHK